MTLTVVANDLPNGSVIPGDRVVARLVGRLVERNQEFRLPRQGIDAKNPPQPQRGDP